MSSDPGTTGILMSQRYINMSDKENMKLVQEVEKYPILYNPGLPEYTRRADTDKAWDAVGEVMNLTGKLNYALFTILIYYYYLYLPTPQR